MNIKEVNSDTNIGEYILNCYYRSPKKHASGLFCGRMLRRIFDKKSVLDIFKIFTREESKENSYNFRQFRKGLLQALDGK